MNNLARGYFQYTLQLYLLHFNEVHIWKSDDRNDQQMPNRNSSTFHSLNYLYIFVFDKQIKCKLIERKSNTIKSHYLSYLQRFNKNWNKDIKGIDSTVTNGRSGTEWVVRLASLPNRIEQKLIL